MLLRFLALTVLVGFVRLNVLQADIKNWRTGETIPGTEGIEPGPNIDLSQANLVGANFRQATLTNADFSQANLTDATFLFARLTGADFRDAIVTHTSFQGTTSRGFSKDQLYSTASYKTKNLEKIGLGENDLSGWDFAGQNLAGADFWSATLMNTEFSNAVVTGANFTRDFRNTSSRGLTQEQLYATASYKAKNLEGIGLAFNDLSGANFAGQNLVGASFIFSTLTNADFSDAVVTDMSFNVTSSDKGLTKEQLYSTASYKTKYLQGIFVESGNLSGWNFSGHDLTGARILNATLTDADFRNANLADVHFTAANDLTNADFSDAVVTGASFDIGTLLAKEQLYATGSYKVKNLEGITLGGDDDASYSGWDFSGQNLAGARVLGALTNADFSQANLANANLFTSTLSGANLIGANLKNASFQNVSNLNSALFSADTTYNQWTTFPVGFDPAANGLTFTSSELGDLDGIDGLTVADVDLLSRQIQTHFIWWNFSLFDLNGDDVIDAQDLRFWVEDLKQTSLGDADLDGEVGFPDFLVLSSHFGGTGGWSQGDFDANGNVQFPDFLILSKNYGQGSPGGAAAVVLEPSSAILGIIGCLIFAPTRRTRRAGG